MDSEIDKIPSTGQSPVLAFDNEISLRYFNFLTMKMTKLDFNVFITNIGLSVASKWFKNHLNPMPVALPKYEQMSMLSNLHFTH